MSATLVCVDAGTTNTRAWLVEGERILARRDVAAGARDTARDGHEGRLRAAVRAVITELRSDAVAVPAPSLIAAAGMITSPQGLLEVPHVVAPASVADLARGARERALPEVSDLPFVFIPGVRTAALPGALSGITATDVMRGEETLCVGLIRRGRLAPGGALLTLGSHWKLIRIDELGRVAWSLTSLAGEMLLAARTATILASALPAAAIRAPDVARLLDGMNEARNSGLSRALFCVRLLELSGADAEGALSFLVGAFIGADLDGLLAKGALPPGTPITISGDEKVGGAWSVALGHLGYPVESLSADDVEAAFVTGIVTIVKAFMATAGGGST